MIKVKVQLLGVLDSALGRDFMLELRKGAKVRDILKKMKYSQSDPRFLVIMTNNKRTRLDSTLHNGDHVKILLPVGGG